MKQEFYKQFINKERYVPIRFRDPISYFSTRWKLEPRVLKHLAKVYDGIWGKKQVKEIKKRFPFNTDSIYRWGYILEIYYMDRFYSKTGKKLNNYNLIRFLDLYDRYKMWRFNKIPMISEKDFKNPKYFKDWKRAFNKHNQYKFKIW